MNLHARVLTIRAQHPTCEALDGMTKAELRQVATRYGVLTPAGKPSTNADRIWDAISAAIQAEETAAREELAAADPARYGEHARMEQCYNPSNGVRWYDARRVIGADGRTGLKMGYSARTPQELREMLAADGWEAQYIIDATGQGSYEEAREKQRAEFARAVWEGGELTGYGYDANMPAYKVAANLHAYRNR